MTTSPATINRRQIQAVHHAIEALESVRQRKYSAGHYAYEHGVTPDVLDDGETTYTGFAWAERDWQEAERIDKDIDELHDLIEMLTETPQAPVVQMEMFG